MAHRYQSSEGDFGDIHEPALRRDSRQFALGSLELLMKGFATPDGQYHGDQ